MKCHEACAQPKTLNYKGKSLQGSILESIFGGILLVALVLKKKQTNFAFGWIKNSLEKNNYNINNNNDSNNNNNK